KDKKIKSCNKNFANLLNFSEDELANKPLKSLLSAKNNPNTVDDFFKQLNLESSWQGELTLSSSLFNPIYTLAHAEPLRVENEPAEMMISFTDISIFLNEVEKLRSSLDRCLENLSLGKYLDILPVAAFVLSRDGGVLKINQEASEMIKESSKSGLFKAFHEEKLKLCDFLEFESLDMVGGGFFNLGKSSSTFNCYHETILGKLKARAKIKTLSEEENTLIVLLDYQGFGDDTF
ncbi:MAG: PAS domain-containing protein, partial [Campylobacteraceae bacterium]|nr:PAS domain-containing protein [Campylobacteraceae bacterium]